ncbi:hypothetical protein [Pseudonocardia nigra]|uniref:hypothetical protein n=1 Tax=Pseudonocardia nigra TaxID=1921578 RepID=UPI001C5D9E7C|nr:hypothetical protein [Pseudonocardia nigra]
MSTSTTNTLSHRDRAVLRAVAAGRCAIADAIGVALVVDGLACCDQHVGARLARAGLIGAAAGPARLTATGRALLDAA